MDYQPQMDFYRMDQMKFVCFKWFSTPLPSVALRLWPNAWKGEAFLNPKATIEKAWSTQFFLEVFPYQFKDQSSYCQGTACPANGSPRNIGPAPTPWKASPKWSLGTAVFVQNLPKVSPVYWRFDLGIESYMHELVVVDPNDFWVWIHLKLGNSQAASESAWLKAKEVPARQQAASESPKQTCQLCQKASPAQNWTQNNNMNQHLGT